MHIASLNLCDLCVPAGLDNGPTFGNSDQGHMPHPQMILRVSSDMVQVMGVLHAWITPKL